MSVPRNWKWILLLLLVISSGVVFAEQGEYRRMLEVANQAYQQGSYVQAADRYEALLESGYYSASLYHNLGQAWLQQDELGKARLYLEHARLLAPADASVKQSLEVLRSYQQDSVIALPTFFLLRWWRVVRSVFFPSTWLILAVLFAWGVAAAYYRWQFSRSRLWRIRGFVGGLVFLFLSLLCLALGWTGQQWLSDPGTAVIMVDEADMHAAPDPLSALDRTLHAGLKVWVEDEIGEWQKVRLEDGAEGWVPKVSLKKIGL